MNSEEKFTIAFFSAKDYEKEFYNKAIKDTSVLISYFDLPLNQNTVHNTNGFSGVCVFVNDNLDTVTVETLAQYRVKLIALRCTGFNNVDLETAKKHNITVCRVPSYSPASIAEHALSLILALSRKIYKAYNRVRENNFSLDHLMGFTLQSKTVGVIGTGEIGSAFCKIMLGLGCRVFAFDIKPSELVTSWGVEYTDFNHLLQISDIISLHCPLNQSTKYILNKESFAKMKDGVMVINTGRGGLLNTKDAIYFLKNNKIGYLGLDVYEKELEIFSKDLSENINEDEDFIYLSHFPNVLITAHQAFFTIEAMTQIASITIQNILDFKSEKKLINEL